MSAQARARPSVAAGLENGRRLLGNLEDLLQRRPRDRHAAELRALDQDAELQSLVRRRVRRRRRAA